MRGWLVWSVWWSCLGIVLSPSNPLSNQWPSVELIWISPTNVMPCWWCLESKATCMSKLMSAFHPSLPVLISLKILSLYVVTPLINANSKYWDQMSLLISKSWSFEKICKSWSQKSSSLELWKISKSWSQKKFLVSNPIPFGKTLSLRSLKMRSQ